MTRIQLQARPREHSIYSGHALLVTNLDGVVTGDGIEGFYFEETRLLSRFELTVGDGSLRPIAAGPVKEDSFLGYLQVLEQPVYVELAHLIDSGLRTELRVQNYAMNGSADLDGDGFIEYVTRSSKGIKNQGWKDSDDAIVDEDGRIVPNPIAVSEVQGYWYAGLGQAALAFFVAGDWVYAIRLLRRALGLKRRFDHAFWMEDRQFYAMALDPDKRQVRSIASNVGQFLATGIVPPEKGRIVARRMMEPDMFSGWGIRTLSSDHVAYNPFSYHLGCVWPVEAGTAAFGFARYGCVDELHRLTEALFAASDLFVANRLPEALGGIARDAEHPHPGVFPGSCEPQGWSAGAIVLAIQALLGMRAIAPLGLLLIDPHLPSWLPDLRLGGVRVGRGTVDLAFQRTGSGKTRYRVLRRQGEIRVLRQPVPQGPDATLVGRARAVLESVVSAWRPRA